MWTAILVITGLFLYFLPAILGKDKRNSGAIFALNLFLGWTLVGWVVALVWAATKEEVRRPQKQLSRADEILKYKELMDKGVITNEEFLRKRDKLMQ